MKRTLRRNALGALVVVLILAALAGFWVFLQTRPVKHPLTLTFAGWTNEGSTRLARLVISNTVDYALPFASDGQSQPRIDVLQVVAHHQDGYVHHTVQSNLTSHLYVGFGRVTLPPGTVAQATLPWRDEYTNAAVMIAYLPRRAFVRSLFLKIGALARNQPVESWNAVSLEAPWVDDAQRRGSPRLP